MKTKFFLFAGLLAACLTSCSEMDEIADNTGYVDDGKSIKIEVTDEFAREATRANYVGFPATTFEEGDQIGIYAVNTSNAAVSSNVAFTRQSDGSWTPASAVVYNPDYKYYAYFPYKSSVPSFSAWGSGADGKFTNFLNSDTFWLADQSTKANFTTSNLMWAEGVITGTRTVKFTMQHKRGLAIISNAVNQWYYTDAAGTKYNLSPVFTGNIPYVDPDDATGTKYFLLKPNTNTTVAGMSLRAGAGKYLYSEGIEMTGTPTFTYKVYHYGQSSTISTSKPSWLTITPNVVDGEPTEFAITVTNSTSTTVSKGTGNVRNVAADATLKASSPVSGVDLSMVDNAGNARASRTTANCYLVHAAGTYKIPLVYGNAIKNGSTNENAYYTSQETNTLQRLVNHADQGITDPWIKTVVGSSPDGGQLIWEDVQGMISAVGIDGDYLTFTVSEENIAEGNAVIAATVSGTIVWSWHVWVTTETLSELTTIDTGSHSYQVAPVNVGQINGSIRTNANVYAADFCTVKCTNNGVSMEFTVTAKDYYYGGTAWYNPCPFYQWGRKDANRPSIGAYNASGTYEQHPTYVISPVSIGTTIQNPDIHYHNNSNSTPYNESKCNFWDMNQTSTGNITTATDKTVYDPCPPGFCVPTANLFYFMYNGGNRSDSNWNSTNKTKTWSATTYSSSTTGPDLIFPASGYRNSTNRSFSYVGTDGYSWSASAYNSADAANTLRIRSNTWNLTAFGRSTELPVRAVAEE